MLISGNNNHAVIHLNHVITARNNNSAIADNRCHQNLAFRLQILERHTHYAGFFSYLELQCFNLLIYQLMQRFYVTAPCGILHRAHITDNIICRNHLRRNKAINIQRIQNFIKGNTVDFRNHLGNLFRLGIKRNYDIFLIHPRQADQSIRLFQTLLLQSFLIRPISVNHNRFRQRLT